MNENDLREALVAIAGEPPAVPPELPVDLARRARNRRRPALLAAAAAVVVGVLAVVAVLGDESTVRTRPAAGGPPPDLVATTLNGAVVVASSEDGRILRTLAPDGSAVGPPARSPDGQWVYYATRVDEPLCGNRLHRVRASGEGPPERVADGSAPAPSPDGTRLAYISHEPSRCRPIVVVRTLATGEEQRWPTPEGTSLLYAWIDVVRWSADGSHVSFDSGGGLYLLDTRRPGTLADARRLESALHAAAWLPDGRLVALQAVEGERSRVREQVVVLDPQTLDSTPLFYASSDATGLDVDSSGRFLLVVNRRGELFLSADRGPLRRLDNGFRSASW
jgi:Tol biopolymer transport system component